MGEERPVMIRVIVKMGIDGGFGLAKFFGDHIMLTPSDSKLSKQQQILSAVSEEEQLKQQRIQEVLLLIDSLFQREETTFRIIIDCLYDVGSLNLINKKFPRRNLNFIMKAIARFSKPIFRIYALYWVKKNSPKLITNWLASKVKF